MGWLPSFMGGNREQAGGGMAGGGSALDRDRVEQAQKARRDLDTALEMLGDPNNHIPLLNLARHDVVETADRLVKGAVKTLEELKLATALSVDELRDMERLKGHELGAKADPAKFKRIFTSEKKQLLLEYRLRQEISAQIKSAEKPVRTALASPVMHFKARDFHESAQRSLAANNLSLAFRQCKDADLAYAQSGFHMLHGEEHAKLKAQVVRLTTIVLQKVYRGHLGRGMFQEAMEKAAFEKMRWELEASTLFHAIDVDRSGFIDRQELQMGLARAGFTSREADNFFHRMDADGSAEIDVQEFCKAFQIVHDAMADKERASPRALDKAAEEELEIEYDEFGRPLEKEVSQLPVNGGGTLGPSVTGCTTLRFGELHYAAKRGDLVRLWGLVVMGKTPVDTATSNGYSALHFAALQGNAQTILTLGALGCDPNLKTSSGWTAMHGAASKNHVDAIQALSRIRAKIGLPDDVAEATPLHWAARDGNLEAVEALHALGALPEFADNKGKTALHYAAANGHIRIVQRLVAVGARLEASTREGKDALDLAAEKGHTACCVKMMDMGLHHFVRDAYRGSAASIADLKGHAHTAAAIRNYQPRGAFLNRGKGDKTHRSHG